MSNSSSAPPPFPIIRLDNSLGATFITLNISAVLFGIIVLQTYIFHSQATKRGDGLWLKAFVYFIFVMDLLQQAINTAGLYRQIISNWGNIDSLLGIGNLWAQGRGLIILEGIFSGIVVYLIQLFYIRRIWVLTSGISRRVKWAISLTIVVLASVQAGFYYSFIASALRDPLLSPTNERGGLPLVPVWIVTSATGLLSDGLIMASMTTILWGSRKFGGSETRITPILDSLILFSVSTGLTNVFLHLASLLTFILIPKASIYAAISFIYSKSYVNSALASLNSRDMLQEKFFYPSRISGTSDLTATAGITSSVHFHHGTNVTLQRNGKPSTETHGLDSLPSESTRQKVIENSTSGGLDA